MHKKYKFSKKAFATYVAISFLFVSVFIVALYFGFNKTIKEYTNLINTVAIKRSDKAREISFNKVNKKLEVMPAYGDKYGNILIDSINLNLPLYYGDNTEILSYGIGHYAGSYFPGEGGSIILAGHNDPGYFERLSEVKEGDKVTIEANYGTFKYKVESTKIVNENDLESFPIQTDRELLILYTCYPKGIGHKTERFVVYAVGDESWKILKCLRELF